MEPEFAQMLLAAITTLGVIVWLFGLWFLVVSFRAGSGGATDESAQSVPVPNSWVLGSAEVDGQPAALSDRAASLLARGGLAWLGPLKILAKTGDRIIFERAAPVVSNRSAARWFRRAELRFLPAGHGHTRVDWSVQLADRRWLLWLGALFQVLGLAALAGGFWLIYTYVVRSLDPAVRWQTFQMLQAAHFLWPVFLFVGLYRRGRSEVAAQLDALAHNLPFAGPD